MDILAIKQKMASFRALLANSLRNRTTIELNIEFSTFNHLKFRPDSALHCRIVENSSRICPEISVFRVTSQNWKTYPIVKFTILGHDTDRFLENSSKIDIGWVFQTSTFSPGYRFTGKLIQTWIIFPVIRSDSCPRKLKFRRNFWMSFPDFTQLKMAKTG